MEFGWKLQAHYFLASPAEVGDDDAKVVNVNSTIMIDIVSGNRNSQRL
jgi:hypothetical protein